MKMLVAAAFAYLVASTHGAEPITVYLGTQGKGESKGIYMAQLDGDTGLLSEPKLAAELEGCGFIVVHPNQQFLYSTARGNDVAAVAAFQIEKDGSLTLLNQQASKGNGPCHVSVDPTGRCLMVANYSSGGVAAFSIKQDGSLMKSASFHQHEGSSVNKARQTGPHAHSIYAGPDNRFAYAPDLGIDKVMIYQLDAANATLTPAGAAQTLKGAGPRHMKFSKDGTKAYVLTEMRLNVEVFDRNPKTGALVRSQVVSTLGEGADLDGMTCSEIRVHPNGAFVYAANRDTNGQGRDSLTVFKVLEDGRLAPHQVVPAQVDIPRNIGVDPSGKWLLVAGQNSGNVPVFKIHDDGKLEFNGNQVKLANAMCVEFMK